MTPEALLGALAVAAVAWLVFACWFWPYKACRRCDGTGKLRSPGRKAWRTCPRCKGTGRRLRVGRRAWNATSSTSRTAR